MKPILTLRDLFWLVLVAALACAWWIDRTRWNRRNDMYVRQIADLQRRASERWGFGMQTVYHWANADEFIEAVTQTEDENKFSDKAPSLAQADDTVFQEAVGKLVELLKAPEQRTRRRAAIVLRFLQELSPVRMEQHAETVATNLTPLLDDESSEVVGETIGALQSLGAAGRPAMEKLKHIVADDENHYAPSAAIALHSIDPSLDVTPRLTQLMQRKHPSWYQAAFFLSSHLPSDEARKLLTELYDSMDSEVDRNAVIQTLNSIKP